MSKQKQGEGTRPNKESENDKTKNKTKAKNGELSEELECNKTATSVEGQTEVKDKKPSSSTTDTTSMMQVKSWPEQNYHVTDEQRRSFILKEFIKKHFILGSRRMEYAQWELHLILEMAKEEIIKSNTLIEVKAPVNICGDIHGQYGDLMRIFNACGLPFKSRYLFLGDYVDRGRHSLEVITLLLACRIQFPRKVYLLRGNHELSNINRVYGFNAELRQRYRCLEDSKGLYEHFNEVFALMPLAAIVSNRILCMHGGLSPDLNSLDDIRKIQRPLKVVRGLAQDLLWADPETGIHGFQQNKIRAVSHIFGEDAVHEKCKQLNIDMVIRAHQVPSTDGKLNKVDSSLELSFVQLKPQEFEKVRRENQQKHQQTDDPGDDEKEKDLSVWGPLESISFLTKGMELTTILDSVEPPMLLIYILGSTVLIVSVVVILFLVKTRQVKLNWYEQNVLDMSIEPERVRCKSFNRTDTDDDARSSEISHEKINRKQSRIRQVKDAVVNTLPKGDLSGLFTIPRVHRTNRSMFTNLQQNQFDRGLYQCTAPDESVCSDEMGTAGSIQLSLSLDANLGLLTVSIKQAIDLPSRRQDDNPNPYFRVGLEIPDGPSKTEQQTKTFRGTASPNIDEEFYFQKGYGEVLFSLAYLSHAQRLTMNVFKARNLRCQGEMSGAISIRVSLLSGDEKRLKRKKTAAKRNMRNAQFNESLTFGVPKHSLCNVMLEIEVGISIYISSILFFFIALNINAVRETGTFGMTSEVIGRMELPLHRCKDLWKAIIREEKSQARWLPCTSQYTWGDNAYSVTAPDISTITVEIATATLANYYL
uniref:Serine/threonine-protein phosphatase n=1 Tax=Heterorhabditis bacteriophora TaxID=37862 RepID=A0A1I7X5A2_HETBA